MAWPFSRKSYGRCYVSGSFNDDFNNDNLPTASGFFFGGTEYDEYFYGDCEDTIKILNGIIKEEEIVSNTEGLYSGEYYYQASW